MTTVSAIDSVAPCHCGAGSLRTHSLQADFEASPLPFECHTKEIKSLKETAERAEDAQPVIKRIHKKGTAPDRLRGLFETQMSGKPAVVAYEPDPELRDTEQVPLLEDGGIESFLRREVLPHVSDARYTTDSVRTGYEISFTRYFYKPQPLRTLDEIRADILALEKETNGLLGEILDLTGTGTGPAPLKTPNDLVTEKTAVRGRARRV